MENIRHGHILKVHKSSYFKCVIFFWYTTEMLFNMKIERIFRVPIEALNSIQSYIVLALLLVQIIFFQHYNRRDLIRIALCSVIVMIATVCSGFINQLLSLTLFVIAAKNEKLEDVIRIIYKVSLVMIPAIILLSLSGIVENYTGYRGALLRQSLGFNHPNTLGRRIYVLVACRFYLHFNKLNWRDYLLAAAMAVFCYTVPNSITATLSIILLILLMLAYKVARRVKAEQVFLYTLIFFALIFNVASIALGSMDLSRYPVLAAFDIGMHGRFSTGYEAMKVFGIKWFGQEIHTIKEIERLGLSSIQGVHWLDNSYQNLLYRYGVIVYIGFSFFFLYNMVLQMRKKNASLVIFLFMIALYGISETELYNLSTNVFLLSLADVMYSSEFYRVRGGRKKRRAGRRRRGAFSSLPMPAQKEGFPE